MDFSRISIMKVFTRELDSRSNTTCSMMLSSPVIPNMRKMRYQGMRSFENLVLLISMVMAPVVM
ncbi:A118R [African swine fever virus]